MSHPGQVRARDDAHVSVSPAFQEVVLEATTSAVPVSVHLSNTTTEPLTLSLQAVDIQQVDANGAIQFFDRPKDGNAFALAAYIELPETSVIVQPGEEKTLRVIIRNTQDLSPGGHYASLIARAVQASGKDAQVSPALSSVFLVRKVGGERYHIRLSHVTPQVGAVAFSLPDEVTLEFENDGNTHTIPHGLVTVVDIFGREVKRGVINEGSLIVLPTARREMTVSLHSVRWGLPVGIYHFTVEGGITRGEARFTSQQSFLYFNPWFGIGVMSVLILGKVIYARARHARHR